MTWKLEAGRSVRKSLAKLPAKDCARILAVFDELEKNPFSGDIVRLKSGQAAWRRRVGSYRIFFDIHPTAQLVFVVSVERRTSKTY